jgi:hypothetical protein
LPGAVAVRDPQSGQDWSVLSTETRAERVPIKTNLRHNDLDELVNEERWPTERASIRTRPSWACCGNGRCSWKRAA